MSLNDSSLQGSNSSENMTEVHLQVSLLCEVLKLKLQREVLSFLRRVDMGSLPLFPFICFFHYSLFNTVSYSGGVPHAIAFHLLSLKDTSTVLCSRLGLLSQVER